MHSDKANVKKFGVSAPAWLVDAVDAELVQEAPRDKAPRPRSAAVVEALEDWLYRTRRRGPTPVDEYIERHREGAA